MSSKTRNLAWPITKNSDNHDEKYIKSNLIQMMSYL